MTSVSVTWKACIYTTNTRGLLMPWKNSIQTKEEVHVVLLSGKGYVVIPVKEGTCGSSYWSLVVYHCKNKLQHFKKLYMQKTLYNCQNLMKINILHHFSPWKKYCECCGILTIFRSVLKLSHSAVAVPHHCRPLYMHVLLYDNSAWQC